MIHNNTYTIDWIKLVRNNTPDALQKPKLLAWLGVLVHPIIFVYQNFLNFRKAKAYQLLITPQVCYLEKLLNDRFDFTNRGIYIEDGVDKPPTFLYRRSELKPKFFHNRSEIKPVILYTRGESGQFTNDFIIKVPSSISFVMTEMIGVVRAANNLPGTKFKIQLF